ncbi:MAG TPA: hypothetical protein VJZ91_15290, partial [Blastocatellia bacterium]|nr:hypothetical protein [Blastocatellia bacterium]
MQCKRCGLNLGAVAKFCPNCGLTIEEMIPATYNAPGTAPAPIAPPAPPQPTAAPAGMMGGDGYF